MLLSFFFTFSKAGFTGCAATCSFFSSRRFLREGRLLARFFCFSYPSFYQNQSLPDQKPFPACYLYPLQFQPSPQKVSLSYLMYYRCDYSFLPAALFQKTILPHMQNYNQMYQYKNANTPYMPPMFIPMLESISSNA